VTARLSRISGDRHVTIQTKIYLRQVFVLLALIWSRMLDPQRKRRTRNTHSGSRPSGRRKLTGVSRRQRNTNLTMTRETK